MQYTSNYNLLLPEGTDTVNLLTQMNPNTTAIDSAMQANKAATVGRATELTAGTVHAITRNNTDSPVFAFTATSNWTAGDSMSVDGVACSVYVSDGTTPATGAYVINSEVVGIIQGSRVTLLISGASSADAADVSYDNTTSGLTADDVQEALDELAANNIRYYGGYIQLKDNDGWFNWKAASRSIWDAITNTYTLTNNNPSRLSYITDGTTDILTCSSGTHVSSRIFFDTKIPTSGTLHIKGNVTSLTGPCQVRVVKSPDKQQATDSTILSIDQTGEFTYDVAIESTYIGIGVTNTGTGTIAFSATFTELYVN